MKSFEIYSRNTRKLFYEFRFWRGVGGVLEKNCCEVREWVFPASVGKKEFTESWRSERIIFPGFQRRLTLIQSEEFCRGF